MPDPAEIVSPDEIVAQRAKGWPDFHPEDFCHRCGRPNVSGGGWWVDSDRWNLAIKALARGVLEILCPVCFVELWEAATGLKANWQLVPTHIRAADWTPPSSTPLDATPSSVLAHLAVEGTPDA